MEKPSANYYLALLVQWKVSELMGLTPEKSIEIDNRYEDELDRVFYHLSGDEVKEIDRLLKVARL